MRNKVAPALFAVGVLGLVFMASFAGASWVLSKFAAGDWPLGLAGLLAGAVIVGLLLAEE